MPSENGWEPSRANVDILEWKRIPGAEHVSLQFMKGPPSKILTAYAADYHAYIEPLRDPDSCAYTPTNKVATSNHLNGTGMDLNWNSHPFQVSYAGYDQAKIDRMREMLAFYNFGGLQIVFWAQDWKSPKDAMHHQMGYGTWKHPSNPIVDDFIAERIRPDGFSTYKRGGWTPPPPSVPATVDRVKVLGNALGDAEGVNYATLLPYVTKALERSACVNMNRVAMWCAQIGHESVGLKYMKEIGDAAYFAKYNNRSDLGNGPTDGPRYPGRGPIQITGRHNYRELSKWAASKGFVETPTFFEDHPEQLERYEYAFLGAVWYWTVARPDINSLSDAGDVTTVTRRINGGQNGLGDRLARFNKAKALGPNLMAIAAGGDEDEMAGWTPETVARAMVLLENTAGIQRPSLSPFRINDDPLDTSVGFGDNADALAHLAVVEKLAVTYGDPEAIGQLLIVEGYGKQPNKFPHRRNDARLARLVLAKIPAADKAVGWEWAKTKWPNEFHAAGL